MEVQKSAGKSLILLQHKMMPNSHVLFQKETN